MKRQDNITSPEVHNSSITESKDTKMVEMPDKQFRSFKNDQWNEELNSRKSTIWMRHLAKRDSGGENQMENLEVKSSINQIKNLNGKHHKAEERISGIKDKVKELLNSDSIEEGGKRESNHNHKI
jgi:hypothetical protein